MIISKVWAMPNKWTFEIKPIKELLTRYNVGDGWVDPFCGNSILCEYRNDHNLENKNAQYHLEADDFCKQLLGKHKGVVFDPPYSYRQVSEHYKFCGMKASQKDTSSQFYNRVMNAICDKADTAISFGWNSNGFGKNRGFEQIEILLIAHGGHHNDTICVVERRIK